MQVEAPRLTRALFVLLADRMGGTERVVRNIAREAARSRRFDRVEVLVLCWSRSGTLDELETDHGVALTYVGAPRISAGTIPLLRKLASQRFDLVFTSSTHLNVVASLARRLRLLRTRRLVTRESTMILARDFGWRTRLAGMLLRAYGGQDLIICQTEEMRAALDQHTGGRLADRLHVIANPLDGEMIAAGLATPPPAEIAAIPQGRTRIAWCGRLERVKRPDRALSTLAALHRAGNTDMHLVMIGDGTLRGALEQQATSAGLAGHVTFTGTLPLPSSVMARCDIGLLTSDMEGFPNVVLEMLASGINQVVTTDCAGGLRSLPGVSALPITPRIVEALAETLLCVKDRPGNPDTAATLAARTPAGFLDCVLAGASDSDKRA